MKRIKTLLVIGFCVGNAGAMQTVPVEQPFMGIQMPSLALLRQVLDVADAQKTRQQVDLKAYADLLKDASEADRKCINGMLKGTADAYESNYHFVNRLYEHEWELEHQT